MSWNSLSLVSGDGIRVGTKVSREVFPGGQPPVYRPDLEHSSWPDMREGTERKTGAPVGAQGFGMDEVGRASC